MSNSDSLETRDSQPSGSTEKWKTIQQFAPLTETALIFIGRVVGPPVEALGGILGDQLKAWRAANLDRIGQKWEKIRSERGVIPAALQELPFGDAFRAIDAASKEEDTNVQDLWAQIICSAMDSRLDIKFKKLYIDILNSINGLEAKILQNVFSNYGNDDEPSEKHKIYPHLLEDYTPNQIQISLENLHRLRVITPGLTEYEILESETHDEWKNSINTKNQIEKFSTAISNIVAELTNFSGSPLNDIALTDNIKLQLISDYGLTRIGFDLRDACTGKSSA